MPDPRQWAHFLADLEAYTALYEKQQDQQTDTNQPGGTNANATSEQDHTADLRVEGDGSGLGREA